MYNTCYKRHATQKHILVFNILTGVCMVYTDTHTAGIFFWSHMLKYREMSKLCMSSTLIAINTNDCKLKITADILEVPGSQLRYRKLWG